MSGRSTKENLLEAVADIAFTVGYHMGKEWLQDLKMIEGSRGLIAWIIENAKAFEEAYRSVEWGVTEGFGDYIEVIDEFTNQALRDRGLLKGPEEV